jgi:hypothetical protein
MTFPRQACHAVLISLYKSSLIGKEPILYTGGFFIILDKYANAGLGMTPPLVSILWLNYNSLPFINTALESLKCILNLEYSNYELIIVDNNSVDGSLEKIEEFLNRVRKEKPNIKVLHLKKNLGFAGGNNVAYLARSSASKYVILLNNDAVPYRNSVGQLVSAMESDKSLGAAQGILLDYSGQTIDNAGGYCDEFLFPYHILHGEPYSSVRGERFVSYVSGAYALYRVKAVESSQNKQPNLFNNRFFMYYEDTMLSLKIWDSGYKVKSFPFLAARHRSGSTFKNVKSLPAYLLSRNRLVLNLLSNNRYRLLVLVSAFIRNIMLGTFRGLVLSALGKDKIDRRGLSKMFLRGFLDSFSIWRRVKAENVRINMYAAPILRIDPMQALTMPFTRLRSPFESDLVKKRM